MNFRCKFWHRRSIPRPRFPIRVQNFSDLVTFSIDFFHSIWWMFAIFLLPVCLTYWPRKYTTRVDPQVLHVVNSQEVWTWYDHPLPSYSVFVSWYVTWPCDLDLWPFELEQLTYLAGHVSNLPTKFKDPMPIRSWVMSYIVSIWLPLKIRTRPLRMRRITWPVSSGSKTVTFLGSQTPICVFTIQLLLGTTTINGHFLWSFINAKAFDCVIFWCVTLWPLRLTLNSCHTWWVRSWVTSYIGSHWLPLKMRTRPLPMYRITRPVRRGSKIITFLKSPTPICLFTIQLLLGYDDD